MNNATNFYIGLDVHSRCTQYAVRTWQGEVITEGKTSSIYKDVKAVLEPYFHSCIVGMEASTSIYPLHDGFSNDNVPVKVANVIRIRELIVKNDKLDARRLSDMLRLNTFPESFIPDKKLKQLRDIICVRHSFLQGLNAAQSRIWALLQMKGIKIPVRRMFSKKGLEHIKLVSESSPDLKYLYQHYKNIEQSLEQSTNEMIEYASRNFPSEWEKLHSLDGIADIISSYAIAYIHPISRFSSEKKLRRYVGVIPATQESGGKFIGCMLPKHSSRALLRWAFTQAAHCAIRKKDSKLRAYYNARKKNKKQKAIMAVAREICDMAYYKLKE